MKRFQAHDTDGSGSLEWGEFVAVAAREDVPEGEELSEVTLRQVFESIDTDGEPTHRSQSRHRCDRFSTHDRPAVTVDMPSWCSSEHHHDRLSSEL